MHVSSITDSRKNLFIRYANHFMGLNNNEDGESTIKAPTPESSIEKKSMGIETLTTYSIFPKQVVNGKTIITA